MVKLLLDSCISKFALNELIDSGYDAIWVTEHGKDPGDTKILEWAFQENRILVTLDKDFGELVFVFNQPHPPVIRLVDIRPSQQGAIIIKLLNQYADILTSGNPFITVDDDRIRIRIDEKE